LSADLLPTQTPEQFKTAVVQAAAALRAGEVVALPTETVYGLAANALDPTAVARIYEVKGRPAHNPIIVHVAGLAMARQCVAGWPPLAEALARAFWPGPLTLVLARSAAIPDIVTAAGPTVGVRWPNHPFIQAVIEACGFPLAAPSANPSNRVSPTSAEHVRRTLGAKVRLIIDGGPSQVGIESTVLDVSSAPPRVLRPGIIHEQALRGVTGALAQGVLPGAKALPSPGLLRKHYAPKARLLLWSWESDTDLRQQFVRSGFPPARCHIIAHTRPPTGQGWGRVSVLPHDARAFARSIYAELHQCDAEGAEVIIIESLPDTAEWRAILDRLRRAAA
jgi:L-threonylcarbamoyladenylate synthase